MSASLITPVILVLTLSQAANPPLTASDVDRVYSNKHAAAVEELSSKYKDLVEYIYTKLTKEDEGASEEQLLKTLNDEHDDVFHRLVSLAVVERTKKDVAKVSAAWALNGKAIAAQVLAERNRKRNGGKIPDSHFVSLEKVRHKLPADSVLIEMVKYRRYYNPGMAGKPIADEKSVPFFYCAWVSQKAKDSNAINPEIVLVDLGPDDDLDNLIREVDDSKTLVGGLNKQIDETQRLVNDEGIEQIFTNSEKAGYVKKWNDSLEHIRRKTLDLMPENIFTPEKHWILGPAADLWLVPFAALPLRNESNSKDANKVTYAIEKHPITYVTTGRDILLYGEGQAPKDRRNYLILANPDFEANPAYVPPRIAVGRGRDQSGMWLASTRRPTVRERFAFNAMLRQSSDDSKGVVVIEMYNFEFKPKTSNVNVATTRTIRFVNKQGTHDVTCDEKDKDGKPHFQKLGIKKDQHYDVDVQKLFEAVGKKYAKLPYRCDRHEDDMKGIIELIPPKTLPQAEQKPDGDPPLRADDLQKEQDRAPSESRASNNLDGQGPGTLGRLETQRLLLGFCPRCNCLYPALIVVRCLPEAKVFFDGLPTQIMGPIRHYYTVPLPVGQVYQYRLKAQMAEKGKPRTVVRDIKVRGGEVVNVELFPNSHDEPGLLSSLFNDGQGIPRNEKLSEAMHKMAKNLKVRVGTKDVFEKMDATEVAFYLHYRKNNGGPNTLIFCTHGFYEKGDAKKNNPLTMCGLALTGFNHARYQGEEYKNKAYEEAPTYENATKIPARKAIDGVLTGLEVAGANLQDVDLVVTIACQTMQGGVIRIGEQGVDGSSIASMRHAFRLAGARTVVATLWAIDPTPGEVMIVGNDTIKGSFFDYLITGKMQDKGAAIREAQRKTIDYLRQTNGGVAHPYYWAGFSLTGDWGQLKPSN